MSRKSVPPRPPPHRVPNSASRSSSGSKQAAAQRTREAIARDVAKFQKEGGRIEKLGNTPLRPLSAASRPPADTPGDTEDKAAAARKRPDKAKRKGPGRPKGKDKSGD